MKIEKNVPIPPKTPGRKARNPYIEVLEKMAVGDSFVASGDKLATIQSAIRQAAQRLGVRITTRRVDAEAGMQSLRVWLLGSAEGEVLAD